MRLGKTCCQQIRWRPDWYRLGCWSRRTDWRDPTTVPTRGLLAARFPVWPDSSLLNSTWICWTPPADPCRCRAYCGHLIDMRHSPPVVPVSSHPLHHASQERDYRYSPRTRRKMKICNPSRELAIDGMNKWCLSLEIKRFFTHRIQMLNYADNTVVHYTLCSTIKCL